MPLMSGCSDPDSVAQATAQSSASSLQPNDQSANSDETSNAGDTATSSASASELGSDGAAFETIEWETLIHPDDLQALLNPPEYLMDVEDGTMEDQISSQIRAAVEKANDDPYQQALVSTRVVDDFDGKNIRLPGFIVPLEFDDNQVITQFFLVPFFGACIHVPPPPPNQIILVNAPQGLTLEALYDPFWVSGTLHTKLTENDVAISAYSMEMASFEPYTEL